MKKTALLAAVFLLASLNSFAQSSSSAGSTGGDDKNFHFGLNVTPSLYWLKPTSDNNVSNGSSFNFGYGVNLEFYFTQNYAFVTGLELTSVGAKYTNTNKYVNSGITDSTVSVQHSIGFQYLELPLLLKMRTNAIGLMKYFGQVGLNPGIRLKATDNLSATGTTPLGDYSYSNSKADGSDYTNPLRLAFVVGLGMEYNLAGSTSVQVAVNYDNGFLSAIKKSTTNGTGLSKGVTLTVGILF